MTGLVRFLRRDGWPVLLLAPFWARQDVFAFPRSGLGTDSLAKQWPNGVFVKRSIWEVRELPMWRARSMLGVPFLGNASSLVFYTDCDEPVGLNELERALSLMTPDVDLVVGYRTDRHDTPRRWLYSSVYNALMRLLFGVRVRDVNFSFKLVRRAVLQRISLRAGSTFIDGELLAEAVRHGFHIVEMPVEYHPRAVGHSSFDSLYAAWYTLEEMLACLFRMRLPGLARANGPGKVGKGAVQEREARQ